MTIKVQPSTLRSSFHADADPASLARARDAWYELRRSLGSRSLIACMAVAPAVTCRAIGSETMEAMKNAPDTKVSDEIDELFADPVFTCWMRFFIRAIGLHDEVAVRFHCGKIQAVVARVTERLHGEEPLYIPRTQIAVQQSNIDPYIKAITPPSYDFTAEKVGMGGRERTLAMQAALFGEAMDNIGRVWPDLRAQIEDVVKIVGYLPDATFRSCSASRYAGVVYLSDMGQELLDIEESIVHEAGHQTLYRLGELVPLVHGSASLEPNYTLPWSGSRRNLFGFLHAFYIYTLLTKYFWRRAQPPAGYDRKGCLARAALILLGSARASQILLEDGNLTTEGRALVDSLVDDMASLKPENGAALGRAAKNDE